MSNAQAYVSLQNKFYSSRQSNANRQIMALKTGCWYNPVQLIKLCTIIAVYNYQQNEVWFLSLIELNTTRCGKDWREPWTWRWWPHAQITRPRIWNNCLAKKIGHCCLNSPICDEDEQRNGVEIKRFSVGKYYWRSLLMNWFNFVLIGCWGNDHDF